MPHNFLFIGLILNAIPEAKIIHVKRHPAATCWSNFKHYFSTEGLGYSYNLEDTVSYFKLYQGLMEFWQRQNSSKIYHLDYDNLTIKQELETKKLMNVNAASSSSMETSSLAIDTISQELQHTQEKLRLSEAECSQLRVELEAISSNLFTLSRKHQEDNDEMWHKLSQVQSVNEDLRDQLKTCKGEYDLVLNENKRIKDVEEVLLKTNFEVDSLKLLCTLRARTWVITELKCCVPVLFFC